MFDRIMRSWELVKTSWQILSHDRKLLVFPVLSGIVTILVVASFFLPLLVSGFILGETGGFIPVNFILLLVFYVLSYFAAIFFNAALVSCVHARLQGRETSLGDGISHAMRHLGAILAWAVLAATVGVILRAIGERAGLVGKLVIGLVGGAWSLVTMFVVPVIVIEDVGLADAIRNSVALFRKTWGESIAGPVSIGLIFGAVALLAVLGVLAVAFTGVLAALVAAVVLFILLVVVLGVVSSAMQGIFVVALYLYARTGTVPPPFGREMVEQAFLPAGPLAGAGNI